MASRQVGTAERCKWTSPASLRQSQIAERGSASVIFACIICMRVCMILSTQYSVWLLVTDGFCLYARTILDYRIKYPVSPPINRAVLRAASFRFVPFKCGQASSIFSPCIIEFLSFTFPFSSSLFSVLSFSLSLSLAPKTTPCSFIRLPPHTPPTPPSLLHIRLPFAICVALLIHSLLFLHPF